MFWWVKELLSSFRFITLIGDKGFFRSKRVYEFVIPVLITAFLSGIFFYKQELFISDINSNISMKIFNFMIFAVPFHLAALCAFSTFNNPVLDRPLKGTRIEIKEWDNEDREFVYRDMHLREYICLLFGYLCTLGILYITANIFFGLIALRGGAIDILIIPFSIFFVTHYMTLTIYSITFLFKNIGPTN